MCGFSPKKKKKDVYMSVCLRRYMNFYTHPPHQVVDLFVFFWMQAPVMKSYPPKLLFTTLQCFLSSIQSFAIAIAFERDPYQWKLGWNVRLLAVAYCVNLHYYFFSITSLF